MSQAEPPIYNYRISDCPRLKQAWDLVRELSIIPEDLGSERYQHHIAQPELVAARDEIDALPTAARIAHEYATCERDLQSPKIIQRPLRRLQKKNGMAKLRPGMDKVRRGQVCSRKPVSGALSSRGSHWRPLSNE